MTCRYLSRLYFCGLDYVVVCALDRVRDGAKRVAVQLEEEAAPLESGVNDEGGELEHHVVRVAAGVRAELVLQPVDELTVVRDGERLFVSFLKIDSIESVSSRPDAMRAANKETLTST